MAAVRLTRRRVEKVWGRRELSPWFENVSAGEEPVGEIWFEAPGEDPELLIKYLFTSEKLSVQVHPDDAMARAAGLKRGKDEAWVILDAEPGAAIALGPREAMGEAELRQAALDGSIEGLLHWQTVVAGDVFYSPAGTIHAIGAGITLVEVQQNCDCTYRLYDYGRPRELHLDEALEAAERVPYVATAVPQQLSEGRSLLAEGPAFVLERWSQVAEAALNGGEGETAWAVILAGSAMLDGEPAEAGEVWLLDGSAEARLEAGGDMLVAYPGASARELEWRPRN